MKFYDCAPAPSPRRVRIFLAEKGISVPTVQVDLRNGEQFSEAFRKINPDCTVPVLVLDDGTTIADAIGICDYFEAVQPEPSLMGRTPSEKGVVTAWQRQCERDGFYSMMEAFRNSTPGFKGRAVTGPTDFDQIPALAERGKLRVNAFFKMLDARLAANEFVAGPRYSIADITAMITVDWAVRFKTASFEGVANLKRWHDAVSARPSAKG
jgi:glutathione S-transferase